MAENFFEYVGLLIALVVLAFPLSMVGMAGLATATKGKFRENRFSFGVGALSGVLGLLTTLGTLKFVDFVYKWDAMDEAFVGPLYGIILSFLIGLALGRVIPHKYFYPKRVGFKPVP